MNHTWSENKCTMCQAERNKVYGGYTYYRGMMIFGMSRPDCIDWDLENSKTID